MTEDRLSNVGSTSATSSEKNESRPTDKHAIGEFLFKGFFVGAKVWRKNYSLD